ncbi:MAG: phage replisome organizer N-terminal domain-containing protein [Candidatus Izemoplasmatales bacterium]|jgi:predicted phage replisome organizer
MTENQPKRYYWLRLQRDFFKDHRVTVIEGEPNGKEYVLFYLKLLVESIPYNGYLRFSPIVPYNTRLLANLTHTNIDIVRNACKIFEELGLMEWMEDGTLFMCEAIKMIGSESESAERVRKHRAEQRMRALQCNTDVTNGRYNVIPSTSPPEKNTSKTPPTDNPKSLEFREKMDKLDKLDKPSDDEKNIEDQLLGLTKELVRRKFISLSDLEIFKYDELLRDITDDGRIESSELFRIIHYIISRYNPDNTPNKYGWFSTALQTNLEKLPKDLKARRSGGEPVSDEELERILQSIESKKAA